MYQVLVLFVLKLKMFILKDKYVAAPAHPVFPSIQFQRYEHHQLQVDAVCLQIECDLQVRRATCAVTSRRVSCSALEVPNKPSVWDRDRCHQPQ